MLSSPRVPLPFDLSLRPGDELFQLTRKGAFILLSEEGLHLGRAPYRQDATFVPYEDITHLVPTARGLWLGTRSTVHPLARGRETPLQMRDVTRAIEDRIARRPHGPDQIARMRDVDRVFATGKGRVVVVFVVAVCVAAHALQIRDPFVSEVGIFAPALVVQGELWRLVTSHFLHMQGIPGLRDVFELLARGLPFLPIAELWGVVAGWTLWMPIHLAVNATLALLFAHLVEQPLGRLRTALVLGAAAAGAMLASAPGGDNVLGASGMVLGLAGAALAMEMHAPERLPAPWRIPRRLFVIVLVLEAVLGFGTPFIAGWAHLGGFAGGYLAGRALGPGALLGRPAPAWAKPATAFIAIAVVASFAAGLPLALRHVDALNRHAEKMLAIENVAPGALNDLAWRIATESDLSPEQAGFALELALRAVDETERENPDFLDTLAEVQFLAGDPLGAIETIDEAIEIAPWEDYFRGQRDRFSGLRDADDRPAPPLPWSLTPREEPEWISEGVEI